MSRYDEELEPIEPGHRAAAEAFLRVDYGAGRLMYVGIACVIALGALMVACFGLLELVTGDRGAALFSFVFATALLTVAVVVVTRRKRFTEMDLS